MVSVMHRLNYFLFIFGGLFLLVGCAHNKLYLTHENQYQGAPIHIAMAFSKAATDLPMEVEVAKIQALDYSSQFLGEIYFCQDSLSEYYGSKTKDVHVHGPTSEVTKKTQKNEKIEQFEDLLSQQGHNFSIHYYLFLNNIDINQYDYIVLLRSIPKSKFNSWGTSILLGPLSFVTITAIPWYLKSVTFARFDVIRASDQVVIKQDVHIVSSHRATIFLLNAFTRHDLNMDSCLEAIIADQQNGRHPNQ